MQWSNLVEKNSDDAWKNVKTKIIKIMILIMKLNPFKERIQRVLFILQGQVVIKRSNA